VGYRQRETARSDPILSDLFRACHEKKTDECAGLFSRKEHRTDQGTFEGNKSDTRGGKDAPELMISETKGHLKSKSVNTNKGLGGRLAD